MRGKALIAVALTVTACAATAFGAAFGAGNLVVTQVGDGSAALNSNATAAFLNEYTTGGSSVQQVTVTGLTLSGSATSEGFLALSTNAQYLTLGGYNSPAGTASVTSGIGNRIVGRVDLGANVNTSTVLGDPASLGNIRSVVSSDGTNLWATTSAGGVRYTTFGSTGVTTQLSTTPVNTRVGNIAGGQLYTSSGSSPFIGVNTVGSGLPTTSGQTTTLIAADAVGTTPSPYDYFFANPTTLYMADDRSNSTLNTGGLQKYILVSGTWTLQYTLVSGLTTTTVGLRGLAGTLDGSGNAILYTTSTDNKLMTITDPLAATVLPSSSFTTLASAPTNTAFRGVELLPVPEPTTLALLVLGAVFTRSRRRI